MDVNQVMDQLGDALTTIPNLRVWRYPPDSISPPAGIVAYPLSSEYAEHGRGMDRLTVPVVLVVGRIVDRITAQSLAEFMSSDGERSVKTAINSYTYTAADAVTVVSAEVDGFLLGTTEYIAATFEVDVVGQG